MEKLLKLRRAPLRNSTKAETTISGPASASRVDENSTNRQRARERLVQRPEPSPIPLGFYGCESPARSQDRMRQYWRTEQIQPSLSLRGYAARRIHRCEALRYHRRRSLKAAR